eukprot:scaffold630_cov218-Pinguiococcus_pyrenoidosus.AAC.3
MDALVLFTLLNTCAFEGDSPVPTERLALLPSSLLRESAAHLPSPSFAAALGASSAASERSSDAFENPQHHTKSTAHL